METQHIGLDALARAAGILQNGGLCAIPTETVYGLAADACNPQAVANIFKAKGRPQDNPLIVHICDMGMLGPLVRQVPETARKLAKAFWPGPLTMILEKTERVPDIVSAGLPTVAVRMPGDPVAREIIRLCGRPLAAPSANTSGLPSPTSAAAVAEDMDGKIDAIVMGDDCAVGVESTVLTLVTDPPRLLRPGGVTAEMLRAVIGPLVIDRAVFASPDPSEKVASPGMNGGGQRGAVYCICKQTGAHRRLCVVLCGGPAADHGAGRGLRQTQRPCHTGARPVCGAARTGCARLQGVLRRRPREGRDFHGGVQPADPRLCF